MMRERTAWLLDDVAGNWVMGAVAVATLVIPLLNLVVPEDSFFHLSTYTVSLLGKYLCYALLALAVDLIWGYTGILSLGHSAFSRLVAMRWA